jgi:predicted component of type VI protein secretion system
LGKVIIMSVLIFLIGALLGLVLGAALCVRYLRQELTARLGPTLDLLLLKLDNVHSAVNVALANWHAELHNHPQPRADQDAPFVRKPY